MNGAAATGSWLDFGQLARTRAAATAVGADAGAAHEEALRGVARQFEALFVGMMLDSMRDASGGDPLFGSADMDTYRELHDRQLSLEVTENGGIGIADMLVRQLTPLVRQAAGAEPAADPFASGMPATGIPGTPAAVPVDARPEVAVDAPRHDDNDAEAASGYRLVAEQGEVRVSALREPGAPAVVRELSPVSASSGPEDDFASPADFVSRLWPHAERVAGELGVAPGVLVAQAALETGWGQHVIKRRAGPSSHNLFGIKADPRWDGGSVSVTTLEYEGGVMRRVKAPFRAYDTLAESFDDYARFVGGQERYQGALDAARAAGGDAETYIRSLHAAGYATDPDYADKVLDVMRRTVAALKTGDSRSL